MFYHAYNNYLEKAYPYDELRPLTCDGVDTWGSYSLTLVDALDTLYVSGQSVGLYFMENGQFINANFISELMLANNTRQSFSNFLMHWIKKPLNLFLIE